MGGLGPPAPRADALALDYGSLLLNFLQFFLQLPLMRYVYILLHMGIHRLAARWKNSIRAIKYESCTVSSFASIIACPAYYSID